METTLQVPPVRLEGYYVTELAFTVRPPHVDPLFQFQGGIGAQHEALFNPDALTINVQTGLGQHPENSHRWQCMLSVSSLMPPDKKYPYDFKITLVGYFEVQGQVPSEHIEPLVRLSGSSMLYSAAREILATTTGRGPMPCVVLPATLFVVNTEPEPTAGTKKRAKRATKKRTTKKSGGKKQQR